MKFARRSLNVIRRAVLLSLAGCLIYLLWLPNVYALRKHHPAQSAFMRLRENQALKNGRHLKPLLIWRDLRSISPNLIHAVLLAEDDTFYQHHGFDFKQMRIALKTNWEKRRFAYGGSTLTQQLARTLYLSPRKSLLRKAKEALITIELELFLSKSRLLELYLNYAEWGRGIYGAEAAAQTYFNTSASDLTPDQAVALASILPSPRRWSPMSERAFMSRRRAQLNERMRREGYLPDEF
ncbi:MAG: monofunctional biosynthetic peptidoglycan transglycosylase [Elusimicrobiota bacterium]|jgi:monofunctional biosynthetic peptidoglycan transglycosylase